MTWTEIWQPDWNWNENELQEDTNFLMTEALDFLMTEDDRFIILESSTVSLWEQEQTNTTNWTECQI